MSPNLTPPESRDCASIGEMLSWHANGTLGLADRGEVDTHVETCPACRASLAMERRIVETMRAPRDNVEQSPHAGWQKMVARLDAHEGLAPLADDTVRESRSTASAPAMSQPPSRSLRRRVNWPAALGAAVAVQAAAIAVLTVALVRHRQAEEAPRFHTVANADPTLAVTAPLVRIAFDATVDEATARGLATQAAGKILAGPSPENVYTFVFPDEIAAGRSLDETVSGLRRQAHVLLVEPVILGEQSHTRNLLD
jgi:anti-sigma factor RsiW